jgi:hypothetical protein
MRNKQTIFYLIATLLFIHILGEWYVKMHLDSIPKGLLLHFYRTGFLVRLITFLALPFLLGFKEKSLVEKYNKPLKKPFFLSFKQKNWLIFSYIFIAIFAIFSFSFVRFSPLICLTSYLISIGLALTFGIFEQDEKDKIQTDSTLIFNQFSINIQGKSNKWLNIVNPFRGILGIAANGAGKTVSLVEPCIEQYAYKGYSGILFDFKFPTLSNIAHLHFGRKKVLNYRENRFENVVNPTKMYIINFTDITRSHRINPLHPKYIKNQIYAKEFAEAIINSLQKGQNFNDKFFTPSAITLLTAIIWFLKKHYPQYCTFPHVVNLIVGDSYEVLVNKLREDEECAGLIRSIITAIESKAGNQLAGVIASLQMPFGTMNIPAYMYVLSGDDTNIDVNDKAEPKVICVGTSPDIATALSPIISLIFTVALKTMNQQGKHHSFALIDEAAQLFIPNIADIPATARSNRVSFNVVAQDILQFESIYTRPVSDSLIGNLNYQIYLKIANLETAKRVASTLGKEKIITRSENVSANKSSKGNSNNEGFSYSETQKELILPNEVMQFKVGEMVGICEETKYPAFHLEVERNIFSTPIGDNGSYDKNGKFQTNSREIPVFNQNIDVNLITEKIKYECKWILMNELPK